MAHAAVSGLVDMLVIGVAGMAAHAVYDALTGFSHASHLDVSNARIVLMAALGFVLFRLLSGNYTLVSRSSTARLVKRSATSFLLSCSSAVLLVAGAWGLDNIRLYEPVLFAVCGTILLAFTHALLHRSPGLVSRQRRIFIVGFQEDIDSFTEGSFSHGMDYRLIGSTIFRPSLQGKRGRLRQDDLALAVSVIRFLKPDDVLVLLPWSNMDRLEQCIDALCAVPARLHVLPSPLLKSVGNMQAGSLGRLPTLALAHHVPSPRALRLKRVVDVVGAATGLVLLSPVLALAALAIRLDSEGPVLFRQKRYGFNQEPFDVLKFRTMRVRTNTVFRQASRNDPRITRVGRFLRRWNIDELPQLANVLRGEMSLVGPRPHAMAHDHEFMGRIGVYARRHNVRPGITGWAQVNGLRGETATEGAMQARVEHDLHYITHWSLWLDLRILSRTVFSPTAYRNAF